MTRVGLVGYGMAGADIHRPALLEAGLTIASVAFFPSIICFFS